MYKMMWCEVVVVALLCLKISFGLECPSESISGFKFNLSSRRNTTGYWTAKLQLEHDGEDDKEIGPWDLEVGHRTKKCGKSETVSVDVTITAAEPITGTSPQNATVLDGEDTSNMRGAVGAPTPNITSTNQEPPTEEKTISGKCPPVPEDYELVDGLGYYKYDHGTWKNWQEAVQVCAQEGAHLIIINSEEEAKVVDSMTEQQKNRKYLHWVGIHDLYQEGKFLTIFNETAETTGYYKWYSNQPSGGVSENCVAYGPGYGLHDKPCLLALPFICEVSICEIK